MTRTRNLCFTAWLKAESERNLSCLVCFNVLFRIHVRTIRSVSMRCRLRSSWCRFSSKCGLTWHQKNKADGVWGHSHEERGSRPWESNLKHCEGKFVTVKMNLGTNLFGFLRKVTIGFTNGIGPPLSSKHAHWSFNLLWRKAKTRNVKRIRFFAGGYSTLSARLIKAIFRPSQK